MGSQAGWRPDIVQAQEAIEARFLRADRSTRPAAHWSWVTSGPRWQTRARARVCRCGAGMTTRADGCVRLWPSQSRGGVRAGSDVGRLDVRGGANEIGFKRSVEF